MIKRLLMPGILVVMLALCVTVGAACSGDSGSSGNGGNGGAEPTPQQTQDQNPAATASSLDFTVEIVAEGQGAMTYRYRARNIGTSSLDFRIDMSMQGTDMVYILSGSTQEGWVYNGQEWWAFTQMGMDWDEFWDTWYDGWESYHSSLAEEWAGQGTWTYNVPGVGSVTYKNITVNPSLPDSLFQP